MKRTLIPYQPGKEEFLAKCREGRVEYFNGTRAEYGFIEGVKIIMSDKYNEPVSFRPSTEDRRIMDRILTWLSSQTGMDYSNKPAAAIRKAFSVTDAWLDREEE